MSTPCAECGGVRWCMKGEPVKEVSTSCDVERTIYRRTPRSRCFVGNAGMMTKKKAMLIILSNAKLSLNKLEGNQRDVLKKAIEAMES